MPTMDSHQENNLIDFSPPSSGISTPISRHSQSYSQSQPRSPPSTSSTSGSYIGSAVLGLWRRLSTLETPGSPPSGIATPPLSQAQLYHYNTESASQMRPMGDGINGPFIPPSRPPGRTPSPRGLPSLEPLTLNGYHADTETDDQLLAKGVAEEIRTFLPERLKIAEDWRLVYSLYQDGSSLATLYKLCEEYRGRRVGFVLVVRDGREGVSFFVTFRSKVGIGHHLT